ncbi:MAG TPA: lantibiotic dehydratase, partial [Longimicrobium sp.]|nr:lantibiotic dehydratase [Longimicrobium sp.]
MSEPWQDALPDTGPGRLGTRFVCRVSGAPADTVDDLRAPRTLELLRRLGELEGGLRERREDLSAALFGAIGAATEKPARNRLIALKRELYNLRPMPQAKMDEALALLPADVAEGARAFAADLAERGRIEAELREAYGGETAELRARFRELLKDADFRAGLMISSRSLYGTLGRYAQTGGELSGKDEKTERGLLRYYTRMAMKATPFSTFCAIISGTFTESGDDADAELIRFHGDPRKKTSYARINKLLYGILLDHLKERPAVRHALRVELNPTLREESGRLVFLTAIQSREVFQRMANNEVLALIIQSVGGLGKPTLGEVIHALSSDPQIEAEPEEAEAYLDKLIEIGFLRFHTGVGEQDADWDLPFRALLEGMDDDHARQSAELLVRVRERTEAYAVAGVDERAAIIEEMHALINAATEAMSIEGRLRRDMPFYEDATSAASAEVVLTPAVRRTFAQWEDWVRLTSRVAWPRGEQATMRHFFETYYGEDRRTVPLLVFYEDFYREHFKAHVEKEAKMRAGVDREELKDYNVNNPFELDFIKRLGEGRDRLAEVVRERWKAAPDAEEIVLDAAEVEAALNGVETTSGVCRSMGSFATLSPAPGGGDPLLVLQGGSYTAGYGKYFSRFLYMLPDDVQEQVRRENATLTGELLAEICGDAQFNANLHPPLLKWEISYPTGESGAADEQLKSSDIFVEPDPEDPFTLRLRHGPTGLRVIPVDLGFLNPRMRPPLYQLLSRFTPPVTFGSGFPESPERRPQPAPAPAPDAQAVDANAAG